MVQQDFWDNLMNGHKKIRVGDADFFKCQSCLFVDFLPTVF